MPQIIGKPPFAEVYESCYEYVYNMAFMRLLRREDAEDVTETAFLRAMAAYEGFDPARASVTTWLYRIAMNALNDHLNRRRREQMQPLESAEDVGMEDAELATLTDGAAQTLLPILRRLTDDERMLLTLRYRLELTATEIGEMLSIPARTAQKRLERVLQKCRRTAEELEAFY